MAEEVARSADPNVCYCGEYGGGVHTKSARCLVARITIAEGTLDGSDLFFQIKASKRATNHDLRSIAALLIAAANKLDGDPEAVDMRITA